MSATRRVDIAVEGGTLAAFRLGNGPDRADAVLAVHGITGNSQAWRPVARSLDGAGELLAVDLRGRGASSALPPPYGMEAYARDMLAVLDACEIERAVLVGHSLGAYAVARFAADHPDRVRSAVLVDGGLTLPGIENVDPERVATIMATGIGGLTTLETCHALWRETRTRVGAKRYGLLMLIPNAATGHIAIRIGAQGERKTITTACAGGTMAIGDAWRLLSTGEADVALAGGSEGLVGDADGFAFLGFDRLKTLSTRNDAPERASRPFDRDRDGFVLGEGSAVLILEREEHARARGARAYAAVLGYASNSNPDSFVQVDESGASIVTLGRRALGVAGRDANEVEHISAHGTSTIPNDRTEARAFHTLFGPRVDRIPVTALKSMTGHAIGASGALETAALALGLRHGWITPTINYEKPDPECDIDVVANAPRQARPRLALKFSYGFGGHNSCLALAPA